MRPIRLTMTAFGPFAGTEIVDFRAALDEGLFGIYGPTGSGKSSIFNAMTFALFGEPAKKGQDTKALRSDHADRSIMTKVSFVFELGDKRYVLHRIPEQLRPKVHGDGTTKQTHEAHLFDATDIMPDDITEDHCGKIIAEKKVSFVNDAVQDLLGYGATQFRQIVLLPQGDFERFLTSGTDDRLAILRQLFDVTQYRNLEEWFKEQSVAATKGISEDRIVIMGRLKAENYESTDALAIGISSALDALNDARNIENTAQLHQKQTQSALKAAQDLVAAFEAADVATQNLTALENAKAEIASVQARLDGAKKAERLFDIAEHVTQAQVALDNATVRMNTLKTKAHQSQLDAKIAATHLTNLQSQQGKIDALRQKLADLQRHEQTLAKADTQREICANAEDKLAAENAAFEKTKKAVVDLKAASETALKKRDAAHDTAQNRALLDVEKAHTFAALKVAQNFDDARDAVALAATDRDIKQAEENAAKQVQTQASAAFAIAEENLAHVQALHLAGKLRDGHPCPVCGASDHPKPATGDAEARGLTDAFRVAQTNAKTADAEWQTARENTAVASGLHHDRATQFAKLEKPVKSVKDLHADMQRINDALAVLPATDTITMLEDNIKALGNQIAQAETAHTAAQNNAQQAKTDCALAAQSLADALATVPLDLRASNAIQNAIATTKSNFEIREKALSDAHNTAQMTRETAIADSKDAEASITTKNTCQTTLNDAENNLAKRLAAAGLTPQNFAEFKRHIGQIPQFEAAIRQHENNVAVAQTKVAETTKAIAGKTRPDLTDPVAADSAANTAVQSATETKGRAQQHHDHLVQLAQSIATEVARIAEREAQTAPLRELSDQFNGINTARLTLETFAIQAMFDHVLASANLRLDPMSGGRYRLEIQDENMKGAAKRGLGIQVFDLWTGKARGTADISGGETFIAALALALGLSDVVESNAGSIRLDTIFIDEGFGSLDGEDGSGTLDQVLQTLTQTTGKTRSVGLISHVAMVKEAIPNGFQIEKTTRGSHVRIRGGA